MHISITHRISSERALAKVDAAWNEGGGRLAVAAPPSL